MGESGLREKGKSVALSRIKPANFHSKRRNATVELSSFIRVGQYKSPLRVVAGILLRSRETQAERARQKSEEIERLRQFIEQQQRDLSKAHEERAEMISVCVTPCDESRAASQHHVSGNRDGLENRRHGCSL